MEYFYLYMLSNVFEYNFYTTCLQVVVVLCFPSICSIQVFKNFPQTFYNYRISLHSHPINITLVSVW